MKSTASILFFVLALTSCVSYRNSDAGIGELRQLRNLQELQGDYTSTPIDHHERSTSSMNSLSSYLGLVQDVKQGLYTDVVDNSVTVRLGFIDDQHLLAQGFNASGQLINQRTYVIPGEYIFNEQGLCDARTKWGNSDSIQSGSISTCWTLNMRGNLVRRQATRATGILIPSIKHTTDYYEYQRIR